MPRPSENRPRDTRPPLVLAMVWVNRLTTICLEMVLPALLGRFVDGYLGTRPWLLIVGAMLGFGLAMWHLLKIANQSGGNPGGKRG